MTFDEICRRASGRRKYNQARQANAFCRRFKITIYLRYWGYEPGLLTALAEYYGVHRSTITRDVQRILKGQPLPKSRAERERELMQKAQALNDRRLRRKGVRPTDEPGTHFSEEELQALLDLLAR